MEKKIRNQFNLRSKDFDVSANWIKDKVLIRTHIELAGKPSGETLDLCCGTGRMGRALKEKGWNVKGLDVSDNMIKISSNYFPVFQGKTDDLPFKSNRFKLVVCRQSLQFLDAVKALSEIGRVLMPEGIFILSLTVPFSDGDRDWLYRIHRLKQPLLLKFYTARDLIEQLEQSGFLIKEARTLKIRESVSRWMRHAPELHKEVRRKVCSMIQNAPFAYKELHCVEIMDGDIIEDWNWIVIKTVFAKRQI